MTRLVEFALHHTSPYIPLSLTLSPIPHILSSLIFLQVMRFFYSGLPSLPPL